MKKLCIYRPDHVDSFTAAWVVRLAHGDDVEFHSTGLFLWPPDEVAGRDIILIGVLYDLDGMRWLYQSCTNLVIFASPEHERVAISELVARDKVADQKKLEARFDLGRSLAGIAFDTLMKDQPTPLLVQYVEADTMNCGANMTEFAKIKACIMSWTLTFENWDRLSAELQEDFWGVVQQGEAVDRYMKKTEAITPMDRLLGSDAHILELEHHNEAPFIREPRMGKDDFSVFAKFFDLQRGQKTPTRSKNEEPKK